MTLWRGPATDPIARRPGRRREKAVTLAARLEPACVSALGAALGGIPAAVLVVGFTLALKAMQAAASGLQPWLVAPLLGLAVSFLVLYRVGRSGAPAPSASAETAARVWPGAPWRTFLPGVPRPDLTGEIAAYAGEEDCFPWRLAPLHALAVVATVGLGAPMGTESPAAYLGVAAGVALGERSRRWHRLIRPAAVGGGAAGVSGLMGMPLVGTAYILELGRRNGAPINWERGLAALVGGFVGWLIHLAFGFDLIRLVVPREAPHNLIQATMTALLIRLSRRLDCLRVGIGHSSRLGVACTSRGPAGSGRLRLRRGCAAPRADSLTLDRPWPRRRGDRRGRDVRTAPTLVLAIALLRALATTAAAAAGGCGGLFVPFLAIGDLAGRTFAPALALPGDLAGSAGAASGIAGGYRLPLTAAAVVLEQGGPPLAVVTCFATIAVAAAAGLGVGALRTVCSVPVHQGKATSRPRPGRCVAGLGGRASKRGQRQGTTPRMPTGACARDCRPPAAAAVAARDTAAKSTVPKT